MRAAAILGPGDVARSMLKFQHATNVQWTSLIEQADAAIIFGGDGTVHRHLATLVEVDIPVLIVPCGSGNDFARALGIRSLDDAVKSWREFAEHGRYCAVDLGVIEDMVGKAEPEPFLVNENDNHAGGTRNMRYFCCVAGVGLDTAIARRANELPRWLRAHGGYALRVPGEFLRFAPFPMKISNNGTAAAFRPTILASVANAPAYGGGMKIAPQANLNDGRLDLCIVRAMDKFKLFCLFPTVYFGGHVRLKGVEYVQTPEVRIETETPIDVYADGEYICKTPARFRVAPKALKVMAAALAVQC